MLFLEKFTHFPMPQLHKLCYTITVALYKAYENHLSYIETFTIGIVLFTSYTLRFCI